MCALPAFLEKTQVDMPTVVAIPIESLMPLVGQMDERVPEEHLYRGSKRPYALGIALAVWTLTLFIASIPRIFTEIDYVNNLIQLLSFYGVSVVAIAIACLLILGSRAYKGSGHDRAIGIVLASMALMFMMLDAVARLRLISENNAANNDIRRQSYSSILAINIATACLLILRCHSKLQD
jgi:hypothetical protein